MLQGKYLPPSFGDIAPMLELNDEIVVGRFYMTHRGPSQPNKQLRKTMQYLT